MYVSFVVIKCTDIDVNSSESRDNDKEKHRLHGSEYLFYQGTMIDTTSVNKRWWYITTKLVDFCKTHWTHKEWRNNCLYKRQIYLECTGLTISSDISLRISFWHNKEKVNRNLKTGHINHNKLLFVLKKEKLQGHLKTVSVWRLTTDNINIQSY